MATQKSSVGSVTLSDITDSVMTEMRIRPVQ